MSGRVDWPGRGATWLGVPALVLALIGTGILIDALDRRDLGRELLNAGGETVATSVQLDVYPGKGDPGIGEVRVEFIAAGQQVRTVLSDYQDDAQGMREGAQPPAAGTRYAMPLQIVYRPSDPSVALAAADAHLWVEDSETRRVSTGLVVGGSALVLAAMVMLTIGARRRGLAWWKWYADAPAQHRRT
ncbi:hypothetical protein E1263_36815 [Kribbella antibiotica]|uniref:DUF3592 domain-containing protein n=1 Tax=Kribbella antibiotica TaxID=190195 RepID=A0A4R4YP58_9ACTN|nr:hypothetical protein [Kribbella antibiotica]TDD46340.1 hypothetical protein E1263_36815 [Kribbella antibiotica]